MSDPRFARLKTDPRFRKPKKAQNKIVVDDRFKSLLGEEDTGDKGKGKANQGKARIDKYGRKVSKTKDKDNLRRFYRMDDDDEATGKAESSGPAIDYARGEALMESSSEEDNDSDDSAAEEVIVGRQLSEPAVKPSRGKKATDPLEIDLDESTFAELDEQANAYSSTAPKEDSAPSAEATSRIAAVNLDWDHVTAAHLYRVAASVLPSGGSGKVLHVAVYPSEFGRERMEREEREGPPKELFKKGRGARADEVDSDEEVNEQNIFTSQDGEDDYDDDALRQYQLDRLRYYYAIITCNTPAAASHIYTELDGTELERSANVFDFSYVPEGMEFTQQCRDECSSDAQASNKGMDFVTDALRHSKVKLTWDEDDPERSKITRRRMTRKEVDEGDFRALLASSSSEDEEEEEGEEASSKTKDRERMRALLLGGNNDDLPEGWGDDDDKTGDLEITFMPALSTAAPKDQEDETTLDRYKRKQKEKRAQKKAKKETEPTEQNEQPENDFFGEDSDVEAESQPPRSTKAPKSKGDKASKSVAPPQEASTEAELELLLAPDLGAATGAEPKHFDMRAVLKAEKTGRVGKKGRRRDKKGEASADNAEDGQDFQMNVKDERFAALHEDYSFAIDPSNPHFKKTKSMQALLDERAKRQRERQSKEGTRSKEKTRVAQETQQGEDRSIGSIVESVKRKSNVNHSTSGKRRKA
ncbi:hypothetical protein BDV93DRAFT_537547 [Ceratobasidium sp. AG-I]|nr:hypothetical protein BDV93DRAFT_537547 [Ceratobasidium sp. AG-I]